MASTVVLNCKAGRTRGGSRNCSAVCVYSDSRHPPGLGVYPGRRKHCSITKVGHLPEIPAKALVKSRLLVEFQGSSFKIEWREE